MSSSLAIKPSSELLVESQRFMFSLSCLFKNFPRKISIEK